MVQLSLLAAKGNVSRHFPHSGFLALTPVVLEGSVRTRLDDDRKLVRAIDVSVALRCYEARLSRTGTQASNLLVDQRLLLWQKPPHLPYAELGDGDWPFRLVLPAHQAGRSSAHFQEYRVFWRVEAVLTHVPTFGLGHRQIKTFDLLLTRYDAGHTLPPPGAGWSHATTAKLPAAPSLRYRINAPPFPLGPLDLVPVSLKLVPSDPHVRVAALALELERRLEFNDFVAPGVSADGPDGDVSSTTQFISSPRKPTLFLLASAETTDVPRDDRGVYAKTVTLQIPSPKSSSHWAIGETMRTALVTLRFFLHVKVTLVHGPSGTAETLDLAPRELSLVSTNESQRRQARESVARSIKRNGAATHGASASSGLGAVASAAGTADEAGPGKSKAVRRPHTSSGTIARESRSRRDRERSMRHTASVSPDGHSSSDRPPASPPPLKTSSSSSSSAGAGGGGGGRGTSLLKTAHSAPPSAGAGAEYASVLPSPEAAEAEEWQWETELERIAAQSRRRSLGVLSAAATAAAAALFNGGERRTRPRVDAAS